MNARNAWSCACGDPYQIASVPQSTRCSPTRFSSLPSVCAAVVGIAQHLAPHGSDVDPHVARSAARRGRRARAGTCRCRCVAFGSYGPSTWFLSQAPWNTTNCMSGNWRRHGDDVVGPVVRGVEAHERQTLVRDEDLHAEVVRLLDHGQPDRGVVEREALTVRTPRGVHLERGDLAGASRSPPSRRGARSGRRSSARSRCARARAARRRA